MRASDVMRRPAVCVDPGTAVRDATALLVDNAYAALPVVDPDGLPVGIVTETDLLRSGVLERGYGPGPDAARRSVAEVMTSPVITVPMTATVAELGERMLLTRTRCLPVIDDDGRVVGVLSRGDLLRTFIHEDDVTAAKVRRQLADYVGGPPGWTVEVSSGVTVVSGEFADEAEQGLVTALVRTVPGVSTVDLRPRHALVAGVAG